MELNRWKPLLVLMVLFATLTIQKIVAQTKSRDFVSNQLLVKLKEKYASNLNKARGEVAFGIPGLDDINSRFRVSNIRQIRSSNKLNLTKAQNIYLMSFELNQANIRELISMYEASGFFEFVEPNYRGYAAGTEKFTISPDDQFISRQWYVDNDGSFTQTEAKAGADIDLNMAWEVNTGSPEIIVAFLDSGLKMDHPEFEGRLWQNSEETMDIRDNDGNGKVDDIHGWNFIDNSGILHDDQGHGTHVTGIFGANGNNGIGFAGVDWNAKLMICKVIDQDLSGLYSWWIEAIYYAVDHGANVINMSLGGKVNSRALEEAIEYASRQGVIMISSMQNDNTDEKYYPAAYEQVIAVGATDPNDKRSTSFLNRPSTGSNFGDHIDVVAPGNYVFGINYRSNTIFNALRGGTSLATPMVTGIASLLLAEYPDYTPYQVKEAIVKSSEDLVGDPTEDLLGWDKYYGYGRVNAYKALMQEVGEGPATTGLEIFPNPVSKILHLSHSLKKDSALQISILDFQGRKLKQFEIKADSGFFLHLDTSELPAGVYTLVVRTKEIIQSKRFIKVNP